MTAALEYVQEQVFILRSGWAPEEQQLIDQVLERVYSPHKGSKGGHAAEQSPSISDASRPVVTAERDSYASELTGGPYSGHAFLLHNGKLPDRPSAGLNDMGTVLLSSPPQLIGSPFHGLQMTADASTGCMLL